MRGAFIQGYTHFLFDCHDLLTSCIHKVYRPLTYFHPPLTHFHPPIISSISNKFALSEKYVVFWYTNLQVTEENSHYLMWLKSLCSWVKIRQRWVKIRQATVLAPGVLLSTSDALSSSYIKILTTSDSGYFLPSVEGLYTKTQHNLVSLYLKKMFTN